VTTIGTTRQAVGRARPCVERELSSLELHPAGDREHADPPSRARCYRR
jgi:hypothetical protein